jgi:hypothetical protein
MQLRLPAAGSGCKDDGMSQTNVELARRGYEAALRGDLDAIRGFLDAEVKWHGGDPSAPGACQTVSKRLSSCVRPAAAEAWAS